MSRHALVLTAKFLSPISRQTFAKAFNSTPDDLDMHIIYDVSHNIAKVEEHISYHNNSTYSSMYMYVCMLYVCMYVCTCMYVCRMYVRMYICIYACIYAHI